MRKCTDLTESAVKGSNFGDDPTKSSWLAAILGFRCILLGLYAVRYEQHVRARHLASVAENKWQQILNDCWPW